MHRFLLLALLIASGSLSAQVFMRMPDNAAAMGLSGASVANPDVDLGITNDAAPAIGTPAWGVYASSALPYELTDWQTATFQAYSKIGRADAVAISGDFSGIEVYEEQRIRLRYARKLTPKIYLGVGGEWLRVSAPEYGSANAFTGGLGFLANPLKNLWIGGQLNNLFQQELSESEIPTVMRIGASWQPSRAFIILAEMEKDLERDAEVKAGVQYRPNDFLVLRGGVRSHPGRPSLGAGILLFEHLFVDIGAEWHTSLGITPALMVAWR